jgi:hypothetical protein
VTDFAAATLRMFSGVLIWAAHFLVIYATTGIVCAKRSSNAELVPWVIGIATVIAFAAVLGVMRSNLRRSANDRFIHWMAIALAGLALIAIVWEAIPVLLVPICA